MRKLPLLLYGLILLAAGCGGRNTTEVKTIDDLTHARIGVMMGSTHDQYVSGRFPQARIVRIDAVPDLYLALDQGVIDAVVADESNYQAGHAQTGRYKAVETLFTENFGIGFGEENAPLRDRFNAFLAGIRTNGEYDDLYRKWFTGDTDARMPEWDDTLPEPPLRLACTGTMEGFAFIRDGRASGFDVELMERFARSEGRPLEVQYINFGGLISALVSGKTDAAASGMTVTGERSQKIAFSDPYFESRALVIVKNQEKTGNGSGSDSGFVSTSDADRGSGLRLRTADDLRTKRIGVLMGSVQDEYIAVTYPEARILRIDLVPDLVMALKTRQCDAIVVSEPEVKEILKHNAELAILDPDIYGVEFGMAFRDEPARDRFNVFLAEIRADGLLEQIERRWMDSTDVARMPEWTAPAGAVPWVVGTTGTGVPFTFIRGERNSGFDLEIAERFAASMGRPTEYRIMTFSSLIPSLQAGRIDMLANSAMITEERREQVPFSDPYYRAGSAVLARRSDLAAEVQTGGGIPKHDGSDVASSRVAAMTGTTGEMYIKERYPTADLRIFDDINDAVLSLVTGKTEYVATVYTTALTAVRKNPQLIILPERSEKMPNAVAVKKGNAALLARVDAAIDKLRAEGTLDRIVDRWVNEESGVYRIEEVPRVESGTPLRVAVSANREPVCFIQNGEYAGLDCELARHIAYDLGRPIEFYDMKFSALIAALESERVDLIVSNMSPTEERRKRVDFSTGYFENPDVLMTLRSDVGASGSEMGSKNWLARVGESFYNNLILEKRYMLVVKGLWQTLLITFFAALLGTVLGGAVCGMRMSRHRTLSTAAGGYINVVRGTPVLVLLMILFYVVFASSGLSATVVAIITFALNMAAYSSEMFRTSILGVDRGQKEAGIALGFTKTQTFIHIVLPQAVRTVLPVYKGEVISMLKMTSVVGYIAVVDLTKASDIIRSRTFDAFFPLILVAVIYFLIAWLIGVGLDYLNKKIPAAK